MAEVFTVDTTRLALLTRGPERLDALVALIDGASLTLRLLYYIYADDEAGRRVHQALLKAAERGVKVALIVDGFGSDASSRDAFFGPLDKAGIDVCAFHPRWGRRYLLRNHQKLALADESLALVGGFNVANDYFAEGEKSWRDIGLRVEGDAACRLTGYFDMLHAWVKRPKARIRDLNRALKQWSNPAGRTRWLFGGPTRRLSPWARCVRADMRRGKHIDIIAAYFAPSPAMLRRLDKAGLRGRARVITAAKTDNPATIGAARFTYPGLLKKGVRVYEYQPSMLHTKLYVIDDVVHIGSANFDVRSLFLNLEIMLRIEDAAFAEHVRAYVDGEIADSTERTLGEFRGIATIGDRVRNALCYFLVAVLDYNLTRRLNFGVS